MSLSGQWQNVAHPNLEYFLTQGSKRKHCLYATVRKNAGIPEDIRMVQLIEQFDFVEIVGSRIRLLTDLHHQDLSRGTMLHLDSRENTEREREG